MRSLYVSFVCVALSLCKVEASDVDPRSGIEGRAAPATSREVQPQVRVYTAPLITAEELRSQAEDREAYLCSREGDRAIHDLFTRREIEV